MSRRKYSDFKNDPVVKVPIFAWLFDKWELYVAITAVAAFFVGTYLYTNYQSLNRILADPIVESEYQAITALNTPGTNWAKKLISEKPTTDAIKEWNVSDSQKPQKASVPNCVITAENPISLLASSTAGGNGVSTNIQIYGAGQATQEFNKIVSATKDCKNFSVDAGDFGYIARSTDTSMISIGDSIIIVNYPNGFSDAQREEVINFYVSRAKETLIESQCVAMLVPQEDATRSFFYNKDAFTGLIETRDMSTNVDFSRLPKVSKIDVVKINTPGLELPEAPLPEGFPSMPENAVAEPVIPTVPQDRDSFDGVASYRIIDNIGPGCGWAWSAQLPPAHNKKSLDDEKTKTVDAKQKELDEQTQAYIQGKMDWAKSMFAISTQADKWNKYAQKVNDTHAKWNWLNDQRINLYQPWINYVEAHKAWDQFDANKAAALTAYKEELKQCQAEQDKLTEWEKTYGNKKPNDDESDKDKPKEEIPPRPAGCSQIPAQPEILSQEKPAEPQAPEIPEGVTIPNSWPKI